MTLSDLDLETRLRDQRTRVEGGVPVPFDLAQRVRERAPPPASDAGDRAKLTAREREVLSLVVEGRDNTEIAAELVITLETVKTHVSSLLSKLEADNRVQAAVKAVRAGFV